MPWENGQHRITGEVNGRPYSLLVRLDFDPASATRPLISGDVFRGRLTNWDDLDTAANPNITFLTSFRSSRALPPSWSPDELRVECYVIPGGGSSVILRLIESAAGDARKCFVTFLDSARRIEPKEALPPTEIEMTAEFFGSEFRGVRLETHLAAGVDDAYTLRAAVTGGGVATLERSLADAGLRLMHATTAETTLKVGASCSMSQLNQMAGLVSGSPGVEVIPLSDNLIGAAMLVVPTLDSDQSMLGLMFDGRRRRTAAVFYRSIDDHFDFTGEIRANYLFTFIHELGHCLNLPHAFEDAALGASEGLAGITGSTPTFMNYPQRYAGAGGGGATPFHGSKLWTDAQNDSYKRFWSDFRFQFAPRELLELRHGARRDILTGDGVTEYRGTLTAAFSSGNLASGASGTTGGDDGRGLRLLLRVRGGRRKGVHAKGSARRPAMRGNIFEFGEPIHVEAELASLSKEPKTISKRLSAVGGGLVLWYETPAGDYRRFNPPVQCLQIDRPRTICRRPKDDEFSAFYKDVDLSISGGEFQFVTPGLYKLRATYEHGDSVLWSNVLPIYVRYPSRRQENIMVPLLADSVAAYFSFRGIDDPSARSTLAGVFGDEPRVPTKGDHPLYWYYLAYEGRLRTEGRVTRRSKKGPIVIRAAPGPREALRWLKAAFGIRPRAGFPNEVAGSFEVPYSNIELGRLGRLFHDVLSKVEGPAAAERLKSQLSETMKARKIPRSIRTRYLPRT
jgi:hypothetical protein